MQILSGGAAWLSGALLPGDVITAIDGEQASMLKHSTAMHRPSLLKQMR